MTFVRELMTREKMQVLKNNFRFQDEDGGHIVNERIAIDRERNIFLVSPGAKGGGLLNKYRKNTCLRFMAYISIL